MNQYNILKQRLASGWNTWNTRSVMSHVLLPEGVAFQLGIFDYAGGGWVREGLIGRQAVHEEAIRPGMRTYSGSYTELYVKWQGTEIHIETATDGPELYLRITPMQVPIKPSLLIVEAALLWNRPGTMQRNGSTLQVVTPNRTISLYGPVGEAADPMLATGAPYLAIALTHPLTFSTVRCQPSIEVENIIVAARRECEQNIRQYGELAETYQALQTCMAWDTIYDLIKDRVISPVSRIWSCASGGYNIFCWDTYFAAYLASIDNKELAYANAIEITREATSNGFVPNFAFGTGVTSQDRSQPPVGSFVVRELYRRYGAQGTKRAERQGRNRERALSVLLRCRSEVIGQQPQHIAPPAVQSGP